MQTDELTQKIIGGAYQVAKQMGYGFLENVYENCLVIELKKAGLKVEQQKPIQVFYEGQLVGEYVADLVVEDEVIVELKSIRAVAAIHEVMLVNYLRATGKFTGLLINFADDKVEVKRKFRQYKPHESN
jgi:GxxExxY protein